MTAELREVAESLGVELSALRRRVSEYPPDLFALTHTILTVSGAYLRVVETWPPMAGRNRSRAKWVDAIYALADEWREALNASEMSARDSGPPLPVALQPRVLEMMESIDWTRRVDQLNDRCPDLRIILELHAIADEACEGVGVFAAPPFSDLKTALNMHLFAKGTLSRFSRWRLAVLPKMRTVQAGMTMRSLSHYLTAHRTEVHVEWLAEPTRDYTHEIDPAWSRQRGKAPDAPAPERLVGVEPSRVDAEPSRSAGPPPDSALHDPRQGIRIVVFPWPFEIPASSFKPAQRVEIRMGRSYDFFEFDHPPEPNRLAHALTTSLAAAKAEAGAIDLLVLPELALASAEWEVVERLADEYRIPRVLSGFRARDTNEARLRLQSHDRRGGKGAVTLHRQAKHHRWLLDESQIRDYGLQHRLNPSIRWWERTALAQRTLTVAAIGDSWTFCSLVCEDLARIEPAAELVRGIGPTMLVALLLDGPQIEKRWSARYAASFADDPGASVLSVTSFGMVERAAEVWKTDRRTVALWKDRKGGVVELDAVRGREALLLRVWAESVEEFTADGRSDHGEAAQLILTGRDTLPTR